MSQNQHLYKHAPWSKKILIPLWTVQLLLCTYQIVWACFNLNNAMSDSDTWDDDRFKVIAYALNLLFNLKLTIYIIYIIIKFANFQLTTRMFRAQSIYAIFLGVLGLVVYLFHEADQHVGPTLLMGCEVLVNIAICGYVVVVVLRMVGRGEAEEMNRPGMEEVVVEVELESGRKEVPRI